MDALVPAFVAALFAEFGDATQLLAILLAVQYRRSAPVFAGVALAALANTLIAAAAGRLLHDVVNFRALTLMLGLALLSAGAGALWRQKPPTLSRYGAAGPFLTSFFASLILGFGDKTQFLTLTIAARSGAPWLAAFGATAGMLLAAAPAIALGAAFPQAVPLAAIRRIAGLLLLVAGLVAAVSALGLI